MHIRFAITLGVKNLDTAAIKFYDSRNINCEKTHSKNVRYNIEMESNSNQSTNL